MLSFYNREMLRLLRSDAISLVQWFMDKGLIAAQMPCHHCGFFMKLRQHVKTRDKYVWVCEVGACEFKKTTISIRAYSFLAENRLSFHQNLEILMRWAKEESIIVTCNELNINRKTIINYHKKIRTEITSFFLENPIRLGGQGRIVQIDESLFNHKPKAHQGRASRNQIWVFGMIDVTSHPKKKYMKIVPNRTAQVLLPIIREVCENGSIIHSDEWASYRRIEEATGLAHFTVNHSVQFVDRVTGVHTQNIESYWSRVKLRLKRMKGCRSNHLSSYLNEWLWRDNYDGDIMERIINLLKKF